MDRKYDLFERLPDGSLVWRAAIVGRNKALRQLEVFSGETFNEVRLVDLPTGSLLATLNVPKQSRLPKKRIRQRR
jgi:hypothetical protein